MRLCEILAMNLKYYRKRYNLSQEMCAEILGTSLSYLNQIEKCKVDVRLSTVDKFTKNFNSYYKDAHIGIDELLTYDKSHITNYKRIDERKEKLRKIKNNIE